MWSITNDPVGDWERKCRDDYDRVKDLPVCANCGEHITQETAVCVNGDWYCDVCLKGMRQYIA